MQILSSKNAGSHFFHVLMTPRKQKFLLFLSHCQKLSWDPALSKNANFILQKCRVPFFSCFNDSPKTKISPFSFSLSKTFLGPCFVKKCKFYPPKMQGPIFFMF